jgi:hypothetical protein
VGLRGPACEVELSQAELYDVVVAAAAKNEFEAIALISALEESCIPAMKRAGLFPFGNIGPCDVMVPRKLLESARSVINQSRANAIQSGVEGAFKESDELEQYTDPKADPLLPALLDLRTLPEHERNKILTHYIGEWVADSTPVEVAQRLAAAGLSQNEAMSLFENTVREKTDLIHDALKQRIQLSKSIAGIGAAILVIGPFVRISLSAATAAMLMLVIGIGMARHANAKLNAIRYRPGPFYPPSNKAA